MAVVAINHYNLRTPRNLLEQLKIFYCDLVGLTNGYRPPFSSYGYWLYAAEKDVLHLSEEKQGETRIPNITSTFDHVAFTCTDPDKMEARLITKKIAYKIVYVELTGCKQIFFKDPAGNGIELDFSSDQWST